MYLLTRKKLTWFTIGFACTIVACGFAYFWLIQEGSDSLQIPSTRGGSSLQSDVAKLEAAESQAMVLFWERERLAQQCGGFFETLWDSSNAATNRLAPIAQMDFGRIILPRWLEPFSSVHGIQVQKPAGNGLSLDPMAWSKVVDSQRSNGWNLAQVEFRQVRFETNQFGLPDQSSFYFSAHLTHPLASLRAVIEGDFEVRWDPQAFQNGRIAVAQLDASRLTLSTRHDPVPFQLIHEQSITPPRNAFSIDPLLVYDLDGDGYSEIILAGKNLILRRTPEGTYASEPLCRHSPGLISCALLGDFDGDARVDLLCLKHEGLVLFKGSEHGTFVTPELLIWPSPADLTYPMVMTCGDIDHDGDLDLFIAQYKKPYEGGAMPTPYYDAQDGYPSYLFLNNGQGDFTDGTLASGLAPKRLRRTYSSSFVDLNADGFLDLLVVSDFAGVDLYQNDGHGHFIDRTTDWIDEPHTFGMAHVLSDFNSDGRLDFLMIGMTSPTVDRLEKAGLHRPSNLADPRMRGPSMSGNRLYFAQPNVGFAQTAASASIARAGWAWGCSAFDADNDGFPDVYVANGMESKGTVRDYESEFWLHDMFIGNSEDNPVAYLYFRKKFARTRDLGHSYGGFEKNRLYLNQQGQRFVDVAHLFGVGLEQDSRNVVSDDLDGDGQMDLVVVSYDTWPSLSHTVRIYRNQIPNSGGWIGFQFRETAGKSLIGTRVICHSNGHTQVKTLVTGDSYRSQHPKTLHFGLGEHAVESAEILWTDGTKTTLIRPRMKHYHHLDRSSASPQVKN